MINSNRMAPPIAPIGLEYVVAAARQAGIDAEIIDLCLAQDPTDALAAALKQREAQLIGITFRNVDDCFLSSGRWFLPDLIDIIEQVRRHSDAPVVLGGVGFSIFPEQIVRRTGANFGIHGDGESAIVVLMQELRGRCRFERVPGLIWRHDATIRRNPPAWQHPLIFSATRDAVDHAAYFRLGGQAGVETKRGCPRTCAYCADPLAKGARTRPRDPVRVADEFESLLSAGADVVHLCDSEFNIPPDHAHAVCDELIRRRLGPRVRWYAYLAVVPFDDDLADKMRRAGCAGINFTGDSASEIMLKTYRQPHRRDDLAQAVRLCRKHGMRVMIDLLLGGPGETPETARETIRFVQQINPDCAGAAVGVRLYPGTAMAALAGNSGAGIRRRYDGPIDLLQPTFYVSEALGPKPGDLVRDLIAADQRFFAPPPDEAPDAKGRPDDYNYNDNTALIRAIASGQRGAYWDILARQRVERRKLISRK